MWKSWKLWTDVIWLLTLEKQGEKTSCVKMKRITGGRSVRPSYAKRDELCTEASSLGVISRMHMSTASGTASIPVSNSNGSLPPPSPLESKKTCKTIVFRLLLIVQQLSLCHGNRTQALLQDWRASSSEMWCCQNSYLASSRRMLASSQHAGFVALFTGWLGIPTWWVIGCVALKWTWTALSSSGQSIGNSPVPSLSRRFITSPFPVRSRTCDINSSHMLCADVSPRANQNDCCRYLGKELWTHCLWQTDIANIISINDAFVLA